MTDKTTVNLYEETKLDLCRKRVIELRNVINEKNDHIRRLEHIDSKCQHRIEEIEFAKTNTKFKLDLFYKKAIQLQNMINGKSDHIRRLDVTVGECQSEIESRNSRIVYLTEKICNLMEDLIEGSEYILKEDMKIANQKKLIDELRDELKREKDAHQGSISLFEYIQDLIVTLSKKEGNDPMNPDNIDMAYIKIAVNYTMPALFDMYTHIGDNNKAKIAFVDGMLKNLGVRSMREYQNLYAKDCISISIVRCDDVPEDKSEKDTGIGGWVPL